MVFVGGVEPFVAVEEGAVFPVGECGGAPGEGGVFEGDEFGEVRADGAEVVVHPGEGGVVDAVGGDEEVFRVVALGADELGDGGVVDEDLEAVRRESNLQNGQFQGEPTTSSSILRYILPRSNISHVMPKLMPGSGSMRFL